MPCRELATPYASAILIGYAYAALYFVDAHDTPADYADYACLLGDCLMPCAAPYYYAPPLRHDYCRHIAARFRR